MSGPDSSPASAPEGGSRERRGPRGRLFWRVYLHGLLILATVAVVLTTIGLVMRHTWPEDSPRRIARWAAARLSDLRDDPARLRAELERAREAFGLEATIWSEGRVLASNVDPPLPPPRRLRDRERDGSFPDRPFGGPRGPPDRTQAPPDAAPDGAPGAAGDGPPDWPPDRPGRRFHGFRHAGQAHTAVVPLEGAPPAFLVFAGGPPPFSPLRAGLFAGGVLLALALASIPLARGIARPVERLTAAVRAFGHGDLSVRARVGGPGEVGELSRAFDDMAERMERKVRAEKELLANVSHELRTPLARIRVALELASEGDHERARHYLAEIGTDLADVERLVEDVLTASRLELGAAQPGFTLHRSLVAAREVVERAAERFRAARPDRELHVDAGEGLAELSADPVLLRRALDNLLDNAAKYSDAPAPVTLAARNAGQDVVIEVADRGIGIDAADLPRLFTPFFRTDRSRARGTGGTGLGLALAKRIAEAHGGSVAVESASGEGTRVTLRLPAAVVA